MNSFVVADPNRCIGCRTCEVACVVAHSDVNIFTCESNDIEFNPRLSVVKTANISAPIQCRHCEDAPCANVCPNGSIVNKDGVIFIDKNTCIGCKTCVVACPFGAIDLVDIYEDGNKITQKGLKIEKDNRLFFKDRMVANKCDLCIGREGGPACMEVCPTDAFRIVKPQEIKNTVIDKRKQVVMELSNIVK